MMDPVLLNSHKIRASRECGSVARLAALLLATSACATSGHTFHNSVMDFGTIKTVAVTPFANLTRDNLAAERVRDVVSNLLLATGTFYVVPQGEVARGIARAGIGAPASPTPEEVVKLAGIISVDAVVTGVVREYGEVRSANSTANVISLSLQMYEAQTGKIVWSGSSTKGGVGLWERLFGGGGAPMNKVTEEAVDELLDLLFQ